MAPRTEVLFGSPAHERQPKPKMVVVQAGTSPKRKAALDYLFPSAVHIQVPGGDEADTPDVLNIASAKVDCAKKLLPRQEKKRITTVYVAADIKPSVIAHTDDGVIFLNDRGKPPKGNPVEQTRRVFETMTRVAELDGQTPPHYLIKSGTVIDLPNRDPIKVPMWDTIELDLDATRYFATNHGIYTYQTALSEFYSGSPYADAINQPVSIDELSGGLSLGTLLRLDAVTEINGAKPNHPRFRTRLTRVMYNALVGISPDALSELRPDAQQAIESWTWLNDVVEHALAR